MHEVTIYTDGGAKGNPGPGGYGVVMISGRHRKEMSGGYLRTTNNRMELMAAIRAFEALTRPCRVSFYSDSKYLVDAIRKDWIGGWKKRGWKKADKKPVLNTDLWKRLDAAIAPHDIAWNWVKGHAGNAENERCDELVGLAVEKGELVEDVGYAGK
ncbi:MAG: ribonuclease HI [Verrucomicrobiales bacterium]